MAIFIPDRIGALSAPGIRIKRQLNVLDDAHVVRTPVRRSVWTPDFFVQHREKGWLAIAVSDIPFAALAPNQLFDSDSYAAFDQLLTNLSSLTDIAPCGKLIVMWACSTDDVMTIARQRQIFDRLGIYLFSQDQFRKLAAVHIRRSLIPMTGEQEDSLMGAYFPEAEINPVSTTRRHFHRDNSARLQRFFLDYQQEWATRLDLEPPQEQVEITKDFSTRLINGVAGSGKTLIAVSRALLLAEIYPEQKILLLIHNTPVVADITAKLEHTRGAIPRNIEISTFYSWAVRQWKNIYRPVLKLDENNESTLGKIQHSRSRWPEINISENQLLEEFNFINESLITKEDDYLNASRAGRIFALRSKERASIWALYQTVILALRQDDLKLWSAVPLEICNAGSHQSLKKYDYILIDEAQFFAPSWFQSVKLAMNKSANLFLCADPNQGFMKSRLSWKSVGIEVSGRTKKLHRSYRTTQAILSSAGYILTQYAQSDPEDFLVPDLNEMEAGVKPILIYTESPQDSIERLINELAANVNAYAITRGDLLVIYGEKTNKSFLYNRLCKIFAADNVWWLNKKEQKKKPPNGCHHDYLRLAYLDTATGLEAGVVFLLGIENLFFHANTPVKNNDEQAARQEENIRKLYMAMTRAARQLILISSEKIPANIEAVFHIHDEKGKIVPSIQYPHPESPLP
ncbi:MAG: DEAD/DEAH box helicase family protein [Azonexus sp.]|jgi:superfamily I DNA/RNA helicase|nr:DEAD/DEAH box helicase family protein [Azonexus sp.]